MLLNGDHAEHSLQIPVSMVSGFFYISTGRSFRHDIQCNLRFKEYGLESSKVESLYPLVFSVALMTQAQWNGYVNQVLVIARRNLVLPSQLS